MSEIAPRGILRWNEWIPLITQQLRLRNVIQITAHNIQVSEEISRKEKKQSYYYTLHLKALSPPVYRSESIENENPKWGEPYFKDRIVAAADGIVVRLWVSVQGEAEDRVVTVWGLYFKGLVFVGPRMTHADVSALGPNSILFKMHGGYFTSSHCFLNPHPVTPKTVTIQFSATQVKPSYSVHLLSRLQSLQRSIKKESQATNALREQISLGVLTSPNDSAANRRGSATLRKLLTKQAPPRAHPQEILAVKKQIEMIKFRVELLTEQRDHVQAASLRKQHLKNELSELNQDKGSELMEKFRQLRRDFERKKELRVKLLDMRHQLSQTTSLHDMRRKELISQLSFIYPIVQQSDGILTIREVHLPNSEDFDGKDETMIAVALGFVAHLVQMIAYFLNVPTRYPICHFGSRSKIIDHITDNIPDKDREFPLYSRGKEKHSFNYGVYLLNKNIAQLRWYCGLTTSDLRHTLANLQGLLRLSEHRSNIIARLRTKSIEGGHPPSKQGGLSCSLDRGLDNVDTVGDQGAAIDVGGCSDPQRYTTEVTRRGLAGLMLLDVPQHVPPPFSQPAPLDPIEPPSSTEDPTAIT